MHGTNLGLRGGDGSVSEQHVLELIIAGRRDGSAAVDLRGIEQVEDGKALGRHNLVHPIETQAAFRVQEIGDMGLLESGLLGQTQTAQFARVNPLPQYLLEIFRKARNFMARSIAPVYLFAIRK